ncbi:MAG: hypothetical protein GTN40_01990 [Candidatus Aenigmarchaeota archaeon]|nr:hypothetical protein [Candidatus Aenigmarchaeota archaeon]
MNKVINNNSCRIFIKDDDDKAWQLFSISQSKSDGSIYLSSLEFANFEWLTFKFDGKDIKPFKISQQTNGHLSIHGSGQTRITSDIRKEKLIINGHHLLKKIEKDISLRHLFTIFPKKPTRLSKSVMGSRKSDVLMSSIKKLKPFVMIAYALPRANLRVEFMSSFCIDDLEPEDIPGILGFVQFPLIYHEIFSVIYRTKYMNQWPKKHMIQYTNGILVPIFKGEPGKKIKVEFRIPKFSLDSGKLTIEINCQ